MKYILKFFGFCIAISCYSCSIFQIGKGGLRDSSEVKVSQLENTNDLTLEDSSIIYPPVPEGCKFVGRWNITNRNDSSLNVYITMFNCEGAFYVTENGITIKLDKQKEKFYETDREGVKKDYFTIIGGLLHLGNEEYGDYTEEFGYLVKPY